MHSKNYISKAVVLIAAALLFSSFDILDIRYEKRYSRVIHKSITKIFNNSNFLIEELIELEESCYIIKQNDSLLGYLVVSEAPSMFHKFDYYIIFNSEAEILRVEVLEYRENYGAEICGQRWLRRFINMPTDNYAKYNRSIDGISGATISVNSIKANVFRINNLLKQVVLEKND